MQSFLTTIRFLVKVTVTVTIEPAVMLLLSSSSRTAKTQGEKERAFQYPKVSQRRVQNLYTSTKRLILNVTD